MPYVEVIQRPFSERRRLSRRLIADWTNAGQTPVASVVFSGLAPRTQVLLMSGGNAQFLPGYKIQN